MTIAKSMMIFARSMKIVVGINAKRRHGFNNQLSPVEFEKRYAMSLQGV